MSIFAKKVEAKPDAKAEAKPDAEPEAVEPTIVSDIVGPAYGIADAMRLMRSLPVDQNMDLVVRVVRVTLSSVNVRMEDIIEDATRRQKSIQDGITALHAKVADLQGQLEARRREIEALEADLKETTSVKERLVQADKSPGHRPPPLPGSGVSLTSTLNASPPPPPGGRITLTSKPVERDE
jgi:hypothetical protein